MVGRVWHVGRLTTTTAPHHLRVEHLDAHVLGLGVRAPRLSWQLPAGAREQVAYEVEVDGTAQGRVEGPGHLLVAWPGDPVASATRVQWRVRVWTDAGASPWSEVAWFETGLLDPTDWRAQWIEPTADPEPPAGERPAWELRTMFTVDVVPEQARLYATAHGIYECFLNGARVGDLELTPGFTSYQHQLHVQAYDVGALLRPGDNEWRVVLSDGWFRGKYGTHHRSEYYGTRVAFLGQLHAGDLVVTTGDDWTAAIGPIRTADFMDGQVDDHTVVATDWHPVTVVEHGSANLTYSPAPPTRATEILTPVSVRAIGGGRQIVDLGQNIDGRVRLRNLGPAGTTTTLVHGEALDEHGDVTLDHLASTDHTVRQTDAVTSSGAAGDTFEPRHTLHGFQFVRVEGRADALSPDDIEGVELRTDLRRTGWFRCSDERLNRLHDIADWSFRGNSCEIPTDCPTRERQGWTGDWHLFFPTAAFLYDVAGFSIKWLRDLAAEQRADGRIYNYAPEPMTNRDPAPEEEPLWHYLQGSSGWGDAIVYVPWQLARAYDDQHVLAEFFPAMVRWVDWAANAARTQRYAGRAEARPTPAPHEQYLWDGGFHWGEWCEPDDGGPKFFEIDQGHVGTAYLHRSALLTARIARMIGRDDEAARLDELAAHALDAWRTEYIGDDGSLTPDTQAAHVRALAFDLVPTELRAQTAARLAQLVRDADMHVGTGFLATPYLLPMLTDAGYAALAYEVLLQDTPPSWLAMVARGATTVWEEWEGIDADGQPHASLNHYSKGAVISFLHQYVAGIRLLDDEPAYRRFRVEPCPGGGLDWADATLDSPYGRIESSWRIDRGTFRLTVTVPSGTKCEVVLPDGTRHEQAPGTVTYESAAPSV
ncbi:MAG: family 78 glycoside hydrolase catalytic domain [Acidimicrobiia bacterium]